MKKYLLRLTSIMIVAVMLAAMIVPALPVSAAINYRTGSAGVSSSYEGGHYWNNLQNIELSGDGATDVVAVALSQLGYQEDSSTLSGNGSGNGNHTEFNRNTGLSQGDAWCAAFCSWSLYQAYASPHNDSSSWVRNHRGDYNYIWCDPGCANWANQLSGAGLYGNRGEYIPKSGDLIFFNSKGINHIGIVVWCDGSTVYTIEGNTSAKGFSGEGGGVYYKSYSLSDSYINGYGKLSQKYKSADVPKVDYSGKTKTAGWYIVRTGQSVAFNGGSIPAYDMFEVLSVSGNTATVRYEGSTGTVTLSQDTALQVTASESGTTSSGVKFGLTDTGVTVNEDGSWAVEMYLDGATSAYQYDAWYGIYDIGVTPTSSADSQGAWGYVIPQSEKQYDNNSDKKRVHTTALDEDDSLPSKRFTFTFTSNDLDTPSNGKRQPALGGTYNVFLFYTDHGSDSYKVARSFPITLPAKPTVNADYEHVIIIGVDGAGTFFNNTSTPNMDRIFQNGAKSNTVRTEDPSMSAQNWTSMLHGVADEYHNINNDFAYANEYPLDSDYPSVFKVLRENYPDAKLGSFTNWVAINNGIVENSIGVDKTQGISDARITDAVVNYVKNNSPKFVFVQFDEADQAGHGSGFGNAAQLSKITELDGYIGQIYKAYEDKGLLDKTLFIVTTDHGGTLSGNHGGMSNEEIYVSFFATGKTVKSGEFNGMMIRDNAAIVLDALGCVAPSTYQAKVPDNLFNKTISRPTELKFGVSNVTVNGDNYEIEMYLEGADNRFLYDAWFGIYDGSVTAEALYEHRGALSQGAWGYVVNGQTSGTIGSDRKTFKFKSSDLDKSSPNANPVAGRCYTIFLFYTDHGACQYTVADSVGVKIDGNNSVNFGIAENGVTVRPDGSWDVNMYLEGAGSDFEYDTWFGIYDTTVTNTDLYKHGASLTQGAWGYVAQGNSGPRSLASNSGSLNSGRYNFSFSSDQFETINSKNPVAGKTYVVYLFKCDRGGVGSKQYDAVASFPLHIPGEATTSDGYLKFGFVNSSDKVVVNGNGSWSIKMFIEGADSRFDSDAWVGIYDADVTANQLLAGGAELSQGSWMSIGEFSSARKEFVFDSSMITNSEKGAKLGGSYNLVLFYSDTQPDKYVVARMIPFTLPTVSNDVQFGLTENGVKVNSDGSWSVEMYLEGADGRYKYDAWYGIYDSTVTAEAIAEGKGGISQGAWGYVVPNGDNAHEAKLSAGTNIGANRIVFSFHSGQLVNPAAGKSNPTVGGTYNIFLFATDHGSEQYTVMKTITISLDSEDSSNVGGGNGDGNEGTTHKHDFADMVFDDEYHWNECDCGAVYNKKLHAMKDGVCSVCGYDLIEAPVDNGGDNDNGNADDNADDSQTDKTDSSNKETSADNKNEKTEPKKKGCGSAIAASTVVLATVLVLGAGLKKKED